MTKRFVLTGGIGCGKSAAGRVFTDLGAAVFSADEAGHAVLLSGGEAHHQVIERWPEVGGAGGIDRAALAAIVFADAAQLSELEAMTHPAIRLRLLRVVEASAADIVLVETPIPSVLPRDWPRVVVDAPDEERVRRLRLRGMTDTDIRNRMERQPSRGEWLALADLVIDNSGDLEHLADECRRVWDLIHSRLPDVDLEA